MSALLFIRHAPTAWNEAGRIQGHHDEPLSPTGRTRAAGWRVPERFEEAACLSSPLRRALQTAQLMKCRMVAQDARLKEMDWGAYEGQTLDGLRAAVGPAMAEAEQRGLDFQPPGGETPRMVAARLRELLDELAPQEQDRVLFTHKGVMRALVVLATGWQMLGRAPLRPARDEAIQVALATDGALGTLALVRLDDERTD